jgi:hypothetical protein
MKEAIKALREEAYRVRNNSAVWAGSGKRAAREKHLAELGRAISLLEAAPVLLELVRAEANFVAARVLVHRHQDDWHEDKGQRQAYDAEHAAEVRIEKAFGAMLVQIAEDKTK